MDLKDLKEAWLSAFPDSTHPNDAERFIRYAIALARENGSLDLEEMKSRGISDKRIRDYQRNYEFLRDVLIVLDKQ